MLIFLRPGYSLGRKGGGGCRGEEEAEECYNNKTLKRGAGARDTDCLVSVAADAVRTKLHSMS